MAIAVEQFVKGLEHSGIISASHLRAVREKLPPDRQDDAQELARQLVRQMSLGASKPATCGRFKCRQGVKVDTRYRR
jgi:hypothetical protein